MKISIRLIFTVVLCFTFIVSLINYHGIIARKEFENIISFTSVFVSALAFMWLIFGYQQQSEELRLQYVELKNQVENTARLVSQTELQVKANLEIIEMEKKRHKDEHIHSIRPMLVFSNTGTNEKGGNMWTAKNVGNSSAINVIISCSYKFEDWDQGQAVLFSALNLNDIIDLNWTTKHAALVAIYSDIEGNQYTTTCFRNKNTITKENLYPNLITEKAEWQMKNQMKNKRLE